MVRIGMTAAILVVSLVAAEAAARVIDGFPLTSIALPAVSPRAIRQRTAAESRPDLAYALQVPRARGVNIGWYVERPPEIPRVPLTPELTRRSQEYPNDLWTPFFEWNAAYLRAQACRETREDLLGQLKDYYYFEPAGGSGHPTFRHLRHVSPPGWFVTNSFGWRGPDVPLNKPRNTIRIAFVGASTTVDEYGARFSHTELIGYWLNRWAESQLLPYRFEVINAGRTGIGTNSIAAIVEQELVPVEPDLVVFYEGANQFWPWQVVKTTGTETVERPTTTRRRRTAAEDYSALARRVLVALDRIRFGSGAEPRKPESALNWPAGVDLNDPPLDGRLPMDLPNVIACLDIIRAALKPIDSELVMTSFVWIVKEGMRLDIDRDYTLYTYLNNNYWPATYAELRELADFQNRVFAKYARTHGLPFIDFAAEFPLNPALTGDAIHFRESGLALEAWIYLQRLIPMIEERVATGRLPKPQQVTRVVHPAFDQPQFRRVTLDALRSQCH